MTFSADSLQGFLFNGSLVGLGLVAALYTLALPRMKDILKRQTQTLRELIGKQDKIYHQLGKDRKNKKLVEEYSEIQNKINIAEKLPFHVDLGYQLTAVLFMSTLLICLFYAIFPAEHATASLQYAALAFALGIICFMIVWFLLFTELRTYAVEEFQKVRDETSKDEKKIEFIQALAKEYREGKFKMQKTHLYFQKKDEK